MIIEDDEGSPLLCKVMSLLNKHTWLKKDRPLFQEVDQIAPR